MTRPRLIEFLLPSGVILGCLPESAAPRRQAHPFVPVGATHFRVPPAEDWTAIASLPREWKIPRPGRESLPYIDDEEDT